MYSVRLNYPMESLDEWEKHFNLSKAQRRRIEEIVLGKKAAARIRARAPKASPRASRFGRKK